MTNTKISSPNFPYESAENITRYIYPNFVKNRLNVFSLFDCTLFTDNSGTNFVLILARMKAENWLPSTPEEVYDYCDKSFKNSTGMLDTYHEIYPIAAKQLGDYFTSSHMSGIKEWTLLVLKDAFILRTANKSFALDLVKSKFHKNPKFGHAFQRLGFPVLTNDVGEMYFGKPAALQKEVKHMDLLWAINQCFRVFIGNKGACQMKHYYQESCKYSGKADYTDVRCDTRPWDKSSDEQLCAFGQIWGTWGLTGKRPI